MGESPWNTGLSVKSRKLPGKHSHSAFFPLKSQARGKEEQRPCRWVERRQVGASSAEQSLGALESVELHNTEKLGMIQHRHNGRNIHIPKYNLQVAPLVGMAQPN